MIISHKHKFIFLKTRKTAGTSIEIALSQFCGEKDVITPISPEDEETRRELSYRGPQNFYIPLTRYRPTDWSSLLLDRKRARYYNHIPAREVRRVVGEQVWNNYFKFCFERNPWDKAVSLYFWRTRRRDPRPSLLRFLNSMDKISLSNLGIYSIDGEIAVDYVGLYENLATELERIATLLKLPGKLELPRAKGAFRKDRRHYREIMGQEESSMIEQACAREIARFGYVF